MPPMRLCRGGRLTPQKAMRDVDGLVESGYRVSEEIVNKVKEILREWEV